MISSFFSVHEFTNIALSGLFSVFHKKSFQLQFKLILFPFQHKHECERVRFSEFVRLSLEHLFGTALAKLVRLGSGHGGFNTPVERYAVLNEPHNAFVSVKTKITESRAWPSRNYDFRRWGTAPATAWRRQQRRLKEVVPSGSQICRSRHRNQQLGLRLSHWQRERKRYNLFLPFLSFFVCLEPVWETDGRSTRGCWKVYMRWAEDIDVRRRFQKRQIKYENENRGLKKDDVSSS